MMDMYNSGVKFCYTCGKEYVTNKPTPGHPHGQPGCSCALYSNQPQKPPAKKVHARIPDAKKRGAKGKAKLFHMNR